LSFAKRIRDTLPEPYYALLTEGKFKDIPPFKYDNDETPFASEGKEIYKMMKQKLPEEQIQPYIDAIQEQASSLGLDPLLASTDVYMTAMCHNGAKSVSHITAAMDRSKTRLQEARQASPGVGRQIVEAVVTYWKDQPGNAVNIVDKLLNYNIILPDSVIEWALGPGSLSNGAVLSQAWRYEIVAKTMTKVTGRVQEIAQAKVKLEVENDYEPTEKLQQSIPQVNDILDAERPAMRQLFATIDDAVSGVSAGAADGFLETPQSDEDAALIKTWGEKWLRTFRRKLAVVEARVSEASVEAQLVSGKEQFKLLKEREARQKAEDDAARAKEEAELQARLAKEAEERAAAEAAAAATEANGDTAMDGNGMNGHGENDDLDVAE
jgi:nuclear cap-binding protein subunit 1